MPEHSKARTDSGWTVTRHGSFVWAGWLWMTELIGLAGDDTEQRRLKPSLGGQTENDKTLRFTATARPDSQANATNNNAPAPPTTRNTRRAARPGA